MSKTILPAQKQLGALVRSGRKSSGICNPATCQDSHSIVKSAPVMLCTSKANGLKKKTSPSSGSRSKSTSIFHRSSDDITSRLSQLTLQSSHSRNMSTRFTTIEDVVSYIKDGDCKSIVVMVGAGISTASGIPDFRSPGTGLYDNLQQYKIPYPEAIFDLEYFHANPKPFFTLAKEIYPAEKYRPNSVHYFLKLLSDKDLLLRLYTQNIDGLERLAGIPSTKLVEAHGTFTSASCTKCRKSSPIEPVKEAIFSDKIPRCQRPHCRGIVKPDIVFFGEDLPSHFYDSYTRDFARADLLLIMGTSLEVEPFAGIASGVKSHVPRVLFNREPVGPFRKRRTRMNDVAYTGDIVQQIGLFVDMLGWTSSLNQLVSGSQHHQTTSSEDIIKSEKVVGLQRLLKLETQQMEENGKKDRGGRNNTEPSKQAGSSSVHNISIKLSGLHVSSKSPSLQGNKESEDRTKDIES